MKKYFLYSLIFIQVLGCASQEVKNRFLRRTVYLSDSLKSREPVSQKNYRFNVDSPSRFFKGKGMLGLLFEKDDVVFLFSPTCNYTYPLKRLDSKVILYWSRKKDCDSYRGFDKRFGLTSFPIVERPFGELEFINDSTLMAKYYYQDWINEINKLNRTSKYTNDEVYTMFPELFTSTN